MRCKGKILLGKALKTKIQLVTWGVTNPSARDYGMYLKTQEFKAQGDHLVLVANVHS